MSSQDIIAYYGSLAQIRHKRIKKPVNKGTGV
jgi:hypothetical protein